MTQNKEGEQPMVKIKIELPTTSELFKKHFNDYGSVGLHHPNMEAFFNDLSAVCKIEDSLKQLNSNQ